MRVIRRRIGFEHSIADSNSTFHGPKVRQRLHFSPAGSTESLPRQNRNETVETGDKYQLPFSRC